MKLASTVGCFSALAFGCAAVAGPGQGAPAGDTADLAKKLSNPVASLISVPLQFNHDENYGPNDDGERDVLNLQPVVPFSLDERWNLISRTILPIVDQDDVPSGESESGLGDVTQSFFFSPKQPTKNGMIWGAGPALLLPTASDEALGTEKWGLGPTVVFLKQHGPWTSGMLANHLWSVAGDSDRAEVNSTFLQPFVTYTTSHATTMGLNTESTYDWRGDEWSVPINLFVSQILKVGAQPISLQVGTRYWANSPDDGAEGWGFRFALVFLFPK